MIETKSFLGKIFDQRTKKQLGNIGLLSLAFLAAIFSAIVWAIAWQPHGETPQIIITLSIIISIVLLVVCFLIALGLIVFRMMLILFVK